MRGNLMEEGAGVKLFIKIDGINEARAKALYNAGFKNFEDLKEATIEDLVKVDLINPTLAQKIKRQFKDEDKILASFKTTLVNFTGIKLLFYISFLPYSISGNLYITNKSFIFRFGDRYYQHIYWVSIIVGIILVIMLIWTLQFTLFMVPIFLIFLIIIYLVNIFVRDTQEKGKDIIVWSRKIDSEILKPNNRIYFKGKFTTGHKVWMYGTLTIQISDDYERFIKYINQ